ncbi:hypothetical protein T265_05063 [Opisthorchis viverrini]|uniref:Uncharacterized protein n=1 Tax=Opisthorchis viverrini TaxID=6198 RepID=A0A074ZQB7_OPIVI|nr:hypothetical protein T265_05063 [Opisthorchis viverrini]KER28017.1 hypothetical protein T265_05063 [Opisthorchis viverrini]
MLPLSHRQLLGEAMCEKLAGACLADLGATDLLEPDSKKAIMLMYCQQAGGKRVALRIPDHPGCFCGGANRLTPTGG